MCNAKPGKRCSGHALARVMAVQTDLQGAEQQLREQWDANSTLKDVEYSEARALEEFPYQASHVRKLQSELDQSTINYYETAAGRMAAYSRLNALGAQPTDNAEKAESQHLGKQVKQAELQAGLRSSLKTLMDTKGTQAEQLANLVVDEERKAELDQRMDTFASGRTPRHEMNKLISYRSNYTRGLSILKEEREAAAKRLDKSIEQGHINYDALDEWQDAVSVAAVATKESDYIAERIKMRRTALSQG